MKRERGEGRIFVRGRLAWIQFYDSRGRQIRESTGIPIDSPRWERKAARQLRKKLGEVEAGIVHDSRGLRYEDIRESYMENALVNENKAIRRDKTGAPYFESVKRLDGFFSAVRAVDIDADLVRKFQREQRAKGLSGPTINRSVASLRRMFTLAARDGKLSNLPAFFPMLPESRPRQGVLPHEKYTALVAGLPDYLRPVVTIGFRTGMRLGEILGLTWRNVNWIDRIIRLDDSKNGESREIPFAGELETVLREQYAKRQEGCGRICFRVDRMGQARPVGNFRKPWRRACVKLGLGKMEPVLDRVTGKPVFEPPRYAHSKPKPKTVYTGLIFHDLRRTFVTDAEHSGAPRHEVMKVSGHKTESIYKRYAIENREARRAALAQIDEYRAKKFGDNSGTIPESPKQVESVIN